MSFFTSKAKTLDQIKNKVKSAKIFDQVRFSMQEWSSDQEEIFKRLANKKWLNRLLIVRSSAICEDKSSSSFAGHFDSLLNVKGKAKIALAVDKIISKFTNEKDEIFIQPMLQSVKVSGVAFTRDPNNNSPYLKINYDDQSGATDSITSGHGNESKVFYYHKLCKHKFNDFRDKIIALCFELEEILKSDTLDIEFAIDKNGQIFLFQVRPLITAKANSNNDRTHFQSVQNLANRTRSWLQKHPYLYGDKGLYGIMPDWNPAEIIGVKPKPLAISLYREVITNSIWAYQRDNYGYCNLRSFPLIVEFEGMPYVDVRVSFNSFIPKKLNKRTAEKLVNYYLEKLRQNPELHDKVEFDILFSCYSLDTQKRIKILEKNNFSKSQIEQIKKSLLEVTNKIICNKNGLWKKDLEKITQLEKKYQEIVNSDLDDFAKIYWLIEDCKRYGTLPFAGLARAGFVAIELLRSMVSSKIISKSEYNCFLSSLNTVSTSIVEDFSNLNKLQFLEKYGHLRPGTYDILSKSYDEEDYFTWQKSSRGVNKKDSFKLTAQQINLINQTLKKNSLNSDASELMTFIKAAIEAREYAKFTFTKNISKVIKIYSKICQQMDISTEDAAFTHISSIMSLNSTASDPKKIITSSIKRRRERFELTRSINLPPLITSENDLFYFYELVSSPNYITQKKASGEVAILSENKKQNLSGKIIMIENADPGYDWIFSKNIAGLITKYGGANSHMAIRSGELGIPAVIGAGSLYDKIKDKAIITIDAMNKNIRQESEKYKALN